MITVRKLFLLVVAAVGMTAPARAGLMLVTLEAPGVQTSQVSGVTTETFDGFTKGQYSNPGNPLPASVIGTFTSDGLKIAAADQYGGAGGVNNFFVIGQQSGHLSATLTLNHAEGYFGFWWSAGDRNNSLSFYSGANLIGTYKTSDVFNSGVLKTTGGPTGKGHYGNPNANFLGKDSGEPFGYLNFIGLGGTTFDKIVFENASLSTGFEMDNMSVRDTAPPPPYPGTPVGGVGVPEIDPGSASAALTLTALGVSLLRRRRKAA